MLLEPDFLKAEIAKIGAGAFLCPIEDLALPATELVTPPARISTTDCAARYRLIPDKEGSGASLWDASLTPYMNGIQDALDDPDVGLVIVPKPARTGGTVGAENHLFKRLKFGPLTDVLWYLPSDSEVDSYARRHVKKLFGLHPDIAAKVGKARTDDTMTFKVVAGRDLEWLQLNARTVTARDAGYIVGDEIDAMNRKLMPTFVDQVKVRGATAGENFKGYLCSHMDAGWTVGIAAAWKESSRGIWYWACPHCARYSSPCPTAPKGWRMVLDYIRLSGVSDDNLLDKVEASAGMKCPHCGERAAEIHKPAMLASGQWVHEGQSIAPDGTVTGEPRSKRVLGFWIHGTMSPWVEWGDLARRFVAALLVFERTKKPQRLREVTAKGLGEVYEGTKAADSLELSRRETTFAAGTFPDDQGALFATAAVDVGKRKFDVMIIGWDLEGRSWVIDRFTIWARRVGKRDQEVRPAERIEDWNVIEEQVLLRELPLASDPNFRMPIAGVAVDTGGSAGEKDSDEPEGVTWKAREFARRMARKRHYWGAATNPWHKVRLIKGSKTPSAPELPLKGREINRDEVGRPVAPVLLEWDLGVNRLKTLTTERLAETEGGPGQVAFAQGLPHSAFEEFVGEVKIDGKWERRAPNESLDLFGYNEAVRLMLRPDRADIKWDTRPPIWARPVPIAGEDENLPEPQAAGPATQKRSPIERLADLNGRRG